MKSVYLIRGNDGKYKIGIAKDPKKRVFQLQTGNADKLKLIAEYKSENASRIESALHYQYSYVRNIGEWFDLSIAEEANFIKSCQKLEEGIITLKQTENSFI
jgi:predicted GIY-YIG superfamily endonuclease